MIVECAMAACLVALPTLTVGAPPPVPEPFRSLADCESGLTWDEGDGGLGPFRGGLQWHPRTWTAVKADTAPADPADATAAQEVAAARRLLEEPWGGWHHWPVCARKLGLIGAHDG